MIFKNIKKSFLFLKTSKNFFVMFFTVGLIIGMLSLSFVVKSYPSFLSKILNNFASVFLAGGNPEINYQGKLTETSGVAVPNGDYNVSFRLYTDITGGTPIWTETYCYSSDNGNTCDGTGIDNRITLTSGLFSVMLGSINSLSEIDLNQVLYLGVEIGGVNSSPVLGDWDGEMSPRKRIGTVPSAFIASKLNGISDTQFIRNDTSNATSTTGSVLTLTQNGIGNILDLYSGASKVVTVLSSGNFGISTTSPTEKLTVEGNGLFSGTLSASSLLSRNLTSGRVIYSGVGGLLSDNSEFIYNVTTGDLIIGKNTDDESNKLQVNGSAWFGDKILFTQTDGNEYIDSLADGYMDYGATVAHRFLGDVLPNMTGGTGNVSLYNLGNTTNRWKSGWFENINIGTSTWSIKVKDDGSLGFFDNDSGSGTERLVIETDGTLKADNLDVTNQFKVNTFYENEPLIYNGRKVSLISPYTTKTNVYKGVIHSHSTNSDGAQTPTDVLNSYVSADYDFISITDHNYITPDPEVSGILYIPGIEESEGGHVGLINAITNISYNTEQEIIDHGNDEGSFVVLLHPDDFNLGLTDTQLESLQGYSAVEVWNSQRADNSESRVDHILSMYRKSYLVASDDCHDVNASYCKTASVMVFSNSLSTAEIMENLKRGNFYSSNGANISSIDVSERVITVTTDSASTIDFIIKDGVVKQTSSNTTTASYTVFGDEVYVRVRITRNSDGKMAWTNPIYVSDSPVSELSSGGVINGNIYVTGTSTFMTGFVGVGILNPTHKLDIVNPGPSATITDVVGIDINNTVTGSGAAISFDYSSNDYSFARVAGVIDSYSSNKGSLHFFTRETSGITEKMTITSDGKIGIGKTAPNVKLDVLSGSANTTGDSLAVPTASITGPNVALTATNNALFMVNSNDTAGVDIGGSIGFGGRWNGTAQATYAVIKGANEDGNGYYGGYLAFGTRDYGEIISERMRIAGNGNVGIGTSDPSQKLEVNGQILSRGNLTASFNNAASSTVIMGIGTDGSFGVGKTGIFRFSDDANQISVSFGGQMNYSSYHGNRFTNAIGEIAKIGTASNSLNSYFNGNLGVGTAAPNALVHSYSNNSGAGIVQGKFENVNAAGRSQFIVSSGAYPTNFFSLMTHGTSFADDYYLNDSTSEAGVGMLLGQGSQMTKFAIGTYDAIPLTFFTGNTQRMYITSGGNVGIGTITPNEKFEVLGKSIFTPSSDTTDTIKIQTASGGAAVQLGTFPGVSTYAGFWGGNVTASTTNYAFIANGTTETIFNVPTGGNIRFRINQASSPNAMNLNATGLSVNTNSGASRLSIAGNAGIGSTYATVAAPTNGLIVEGNVGIGTTDPTSRLTVDGTVRFSSLGSSGANLTTDSLGNVSVSSDERLKDIQGFYERGLADVMKINPIRYKWKEETGYDTSNTYSGFSAQNMSLAIPEAVATSTNGFLTLADRPIIAALVNSVKQIGSFVLKIENEIAYLKNIAVETFIVGSKDKPSGITMYDESTGDPYCIKVIDGYLVNVDGECNDISSNSIATVLDTEDLESTTTQQLSTSTDSISILSYEEGISSVTTQTEPVVIQDVSTSTDVSDNSTIINNSTTTEDSNTIENNGISSNEDTISTTTEQSTSTDQSIIEGNSSNEDIITTDSIISTTTEQSTSTDQSIIDINSSNDYSTSTDELQLGAAVFNAKNIQSYLSVIVLIIQIFMMVWFGSYIYSTKKKNK